MANYQHARETDLSKLASATHPNVKRCIRDLCWHAARPRSCVIEPQSPSLIQHWREMETVSGSAQPRFIGNAEASAAPDSEAVFGYELMIFFIFDH